MKKYNIDQNIKESILSSEYYNMRSSRNFYKGTSFKMSLWELNSHYFNDENIVDFVSYKGCLLTCTRNHVSSIYNEPKVVIENNIITGIEDNIFWRFVMGTNGKGEKGDKGDTFTYNDFTEEQLLSLVGPKGEKGNDGKDGLPGINGKDGINGTDGIDGLSGRDGSNGKDGVGVIPGGITGQVLTKKSNNDYDTVWSYVDQQTVPNFVAEVENVTSTTTANANVILENSTFKFSFGIPKGKDGVPGKDGINGENGQDAVSPNWKTYVYKLSNSKPEKPIGNSINPEGWDDYPTTVGNWWQCIGTVNGITQLVTEWSEVLPVNGKDGVAQDGKYTEFRFAVNTSNKTHPALNKTERTPSNWFLTPPDKPNGSFIWMITATINPNDTLFTNWSTPVYISGENGIDGNDGTPGLPGSDGRTSYFHIKYSAIPTPTDAGHMTETPNLYIGTYVDFIQLDSTNPIDYTWSRFEGLQGSKGEQGIPGINGEDGTTSYLHIKYSNDGGKTFTGNNGEDPGSWLGIYVDDILNDSSDPSVYKWTKIQGEQGLTGAAGAPGVAGKDGVDGLPGIGIELRYCLGTETSFTGINNPGIMREPTGWTLSIPTKTTVNPYIWFIQARINYTDNTDKVGTIEGSWTKPERLSGLNGLNGTNGSKAPIIYPEGVYSISTIYTSTVDKAPYVFDSVDNNYYILNIVGSWQGSTFPVEVQLPSTDTSGSWLKLDAYEAIYSKIGIFGNALIGAAVFNGDFVFSQHGVDKEGNPSTRYEEFIPATPTGGIFTPNILFNFKTGSGHLSAGKIKFDDTGGVEAVDLQLTGNSGIIPNVINIGEGHIGTIKDLYSFTPYSDSTVYLDMNLGQNKNNLFIIGNIYKGELINNSGFIAEIQATHSTFVSVSYNGKGEPDGDRITAQKLQLRRHSILKYLWIPSKYNINGFWEGEIIIENNEAFGYIADQQDTDSYFCSKGVSKSSINSDMVSKGVIDITASGSISLNNTSSTDIQRLYIKKISTKQWQLFYMDYSYPIISLDNIIFMVNPIYTANTFITFSCMPNTTDASKPVIDIFLSSEIPTLTKGIETYFIALLK